MWRLSYFDRPYQDRRRSNARVGRRLKCSGTGIDTRKDDERSGHSALIVLSIYARGQLATRVLCSYQLGKSFRGGASAKRTPQRHFASWTGR